jgi:hypothetical protein
LSQTVAIAEAMSPDSLQSLFRETVRSRRIAQLALARQRVSEA